MSDQTFDACIFDFGGVLTTSIRESFEEEERALGVPPGSLLRAFIHPGAHGADTPYHLLEKGLISEREFYEQMHARLCELAGGHVAWPDDPAEIRRTLFGRLRTNEPILDAASAIAQHYKTAICSNNVKEWTDWRALVGAERFHLVIDSSEVGMRKPDADIYLLTCERLGVEPARAVFIDDIPQNVDGARAVGLHAIRFTTNDEVLAELARCFPLAFATQETSHA